MSEMLIKINWLFNTARIWNVKLCMKIVSSIYLCLDELISLKLNIKLRLKDNISGSCKSWMFFSLTSAIFDRRTFILIGKCHRWCLSIIAHYRPTDYRRSHDRKIVAYDLVIVGTSHPGECNINFHCFGTLAAKYLLSPSH